MVLATLGGRPAGAAGTSDGFAVRHRYGFDAWDQAQGLPQPTVRAVLQTRDGYLWLGTTGGLVRFDGVTFKRHSVQTGDLHDNEVRTLLEDGAGRLWAGTFGGGISRYQHGRFEHLAKADGLPDDVIRRIEADGDHVWVATPKGVARATGDRFTLYPIGDGSPAPVDLCVTVPGRVFVASQSGLYHLAGARFEAVAGAVAANDGAITVLERGREGALWIGFDTGTVKRLRDGRFDVHRPDRRIVDEIYAIDEDRHGRVWVGSIHGLSRLHDDGTFEPIAPAGDDRRSRIVRSLLLDREDGLWLGTETGLLRMRENQLVTVATEDGLPDDTVRSVTEDETGALWIATARGVVRLQDGRISEIKDPTGASIPAWSVVTGRDGDVWIASGRRLLVHRKGRVHPLPDWPEPPSGIRALAHDGAGRLWVGSYRDGLYLVEGGTTRAFRTEDGLCSNAVRDVRPDGRGAVWIATFGGGVCRWADGTFTSFPETKAGAAHALHTIEDEAGAVWMATRSGVLRLKDGRFARITERDGLTSSFVYRIQDDGRGRFWFACALGIFSVAKAELNDFADGKIPGVTSIAYGVKNGMKSVVCTVAVQPSGHRTRDGRLLFATLGGLVIVDLARLETNPHAPPVAISDVTIDKRAVDPKAFADVPPGDGGVEIQYAGLSYLVPENVLFRYKLEGLDQEWIDAGTRRFAHYAQLPPGQYRFRVTASNNDGVWNETGASFAFRLQPHFYQTRAFQVAVLVLLGLAVAASLRFQARRAKEREEELRRRVAAAVAEVKALTGLIPICAACKKVRDDTGYWASVETYISDRSDVDFSHGICPECIVKLYPDYVEPPPEG